MHYTINIQTLFELLIFIIIGAEQIGFVCVVGNKTLPAILTSVVLFTCSTFTSFPYKGNDEHPYKGIARYPYMGVVAYPCMDKFKLFIYGLP